MTSAAGFVLTGPNFVRFDFAQASKDERHRRFQRPGRPKFWAYGIVIGAGREFYWQLAQPDDATALQANGQGPFIAGSIFVGGDERRGVHEPAVAEVVIEEGLDQQLRVAVGVW